MQSSPPPAVIFDVDGTLVDSNYLHTLAWYRALRAHDVEIEMYRLHRAIGMGSDQFLEHFLGHPDPDLSAAHSEEMERLRADLRPFPGARDLLLDLHRRGLTVAWATSAKPEELENLARLVGAGEAVDIVVGAEDVAASKPAPDLFQVALERTGTHPDRAIAVGDSRWDVEAANRCRIPCLGLLSGGTSEAELQAAGAAAVFTDVQSLLEGLAQSPLARLLSG